MGSESSTAWAQALTRWYGPVEVLGDAAALGGASVRGRVFGDVRVSEVRCPAVEVRGGYDDGGARCHLVLVLEGEAVLDQAGRTARAGAGEVLLLDTARTFLLRLTAPRNVVVAARLPPDTPAPDRPDRQLLPLVARFLAALVRGGTPEEPGGDLLRRIQSYVLDHLGDARLTPDRVAAAHHISTRYLHRLFQRQDLTVAAWIKAQRLERCRTDLGDPGLRHLPVHAIAARWGFAQAAEFSRAFRAAYGTTPTAFRASTVWVHSPTRNCARHANDVLALPRQTHG